MLFVKNALIRITLNEDDFVRQITLSLYLRKTVKRCFAGPRHALSCDIQSGSHM